MSLTKNDLFVLGFLLDRPMHGYEISQMLQSESVDVWFEMSTASIYYSLKKLHRQSLIAETRTRGNSGDKTVYHITEQGRQQFFEGMISLLDSSEPVRSEYDVGVFMLNRLPEGQAIKLLENRVSYLEHQVVILEQYREERAAHSLQWAILDHTLQMMLLDIQWLSDITQQLRERRENDQQDLMTMEGKLQELHLPDVLKLISSGKHSGTLSLSQQGLSRTITFDAGKLRCISAQNQGEILFEPQKVKDAIYDLFIWQKGTFVFDQRVCTREGCVMLSSSVGDLILSGARKLDNWNVIQHFVPSSEVVFEKLQIPATEEFHLTEEETRILHLVDGFRDVIAISRAMELTEFETSKILYTLRLADLIQHVDADRNRLRRVFREFAELMCRSAIPYRTTPEEAILCEQEVNQRCATLPVRIINSHIEDKTDSTVPIDKLATIYRTFLRTQYEVLCRRLSQEIADELRQQVYTLINPALIQILEKYSLLQI